MVPTGMTYLINPTQNGAAQLIKKRIPGIPNIRRANTDGMKRLLKTTNLKRQTEPFWTNTTMIGKQRIQVLSIKVQYLTYLVQSRYNYRKNFLYIQANNKIGYRRAVVLGFINYWDTLLLFNE